MTGDWVEGPIYDGTPCWFWQGTKKKGYGPHKKFYELYKGPVPYGAVLHHKCNRGPEGCVNPDHLQPTTYFVNNWIAANRKRGQMAWTKLRIKRYLHDEVTNRARTVRKNAHLRTNLP